MDKLIAILEKLAEKYNFSDEEVYEINEILYGSEDEPGLYGDEYAADEEEYEEDEYED